MTSEKRAQKFHTDDASDLGSVSDWLIALVPLTSLREETNSGVAKCRLPSQATKRPILFNRTKEDRLETLPVSCSENNQHL